MSANSQNRSPKVIVLGNCVAQRLQNMLAVLPAFQHSFQIVPAPMVHLLDQAGQWEALASLALSCDVIFTQPLFNFGPCNTLALKKAARTGQTVLVFASPNFEAYFPDAFVPRIVGEKKFEPVLDWHSSIIFSCFLEGRSVFDVTDLYLNHRLFSRTAMRKQVFQALENYAARERNLDLSTCGYALRNYAGRKLFHTPKHPVDDLLGRMFGDLLASLGLVSPVPESCVDGFGFNQWPVITRQHNLFSFAEQDYFMVAGRRFSLEDVAMAYYNFYEFHPQIVEANRDRALVPD